VFVKKQSCFKHISPSVSHCLKLSKGYPIVDAINFSKTTLTFLFSKYKKIHSKVNEFFLK